MWKMSHFGEIFRLCDHCSPYVLHMLLLELCSNFHITQALWKHSFYFTFMSFFKVVQAMSIVGSIIIRPQNISMLTLGLVESVNVRRENHTCGDSWVNRRPPWIRGTVSIMAVLPLRKEGSWGGGAHTKAGQRWGWGGCKARELARWQGRLPPDSLQGWYGSGHSLHASGFGAVREWISVLQHTVSGTLL